MGALSTTIDTDSTAIVDDRPDAELLDDMHKGKTESYRLLYERHRAAAYNLARQLGGGQADWDELVSEAFLKVLDAVLSGKTLTAFRAYLLTTLRHRAYDNMRRGKKFDFVDDVTQAQGVRPDSVAHPFIDTVTADCDQTMAAAAFRTLPQRWQEVLTYTELGGMSPAEVAPLLGLTPNGVSALAYRAREGLKQAFLQAHVRSEVEKRCQATVDRLGATARNGLCRREKEQVAAHLDECAGCRARLGDLTEVNGQFR